MEREMRRNSEEQADREYQQRIAAEYEERIDAARAGLCSFASAEAGGAAYERDLAETALELREVSGIAEPVAAALAGWRAAVSRRVA
jgi:hypothetical protein